MPQAAPRRRRVLREAAVAAAAGGLLVFAGVGLARVSRLAAIGEGYVAKQGCSCVFLNDRELADCRADMPPTMRDIRAALQRDPPGVRAWLPGLGARTARFHEGSGCTLE
jgi:hypothetical protein